ncbi:hypothetical protein Tco_0520789 [Tanacetum coccineum]
MHANKSFNRNPDNHRLYHALMEALTEDENTMDKGVADTIQDHKRMHDDDEDDDDDEDPQPGPPTPDPEWNKRQVVLDQPVQDWFNQMVSATKDHLTFNDLMDTPIDFSKYVLNGFKIDNLTQDILLGPAFNLLKDACSSSIELEYNFQECFNAPLGHQTVVVDYFFNKDLEYLKTSDPEVTYTTSITKTKAARYEIEGIEDMVPTLWSPTKVGYDKDALKGIKHWGERRKLWYRSQLNKFSKHNVYSTKKNLGMKSDSVKKLHGYGHLEEIAVKRADLTRRNSTSLHLNISQLKKFSEHNVYSTKKILGVKSVSVKKLHGYDHLEEIVVKRAHRQLYKFKEGDFVDLHLNDIEDMLLLVVQHKLFHLIDSDIVDVIMALRMFTRRLVIKKRVEDLQLGIESYHKKLNITPP